MGKRCRLQPFMPPRKGISPRVHGRLFYEGQEKQLCKVCGEPRDALHSDEDCADRWIAEQDAELARIKEGRTP